MWFPRIELAICLAILPALAFGAAGGFERKGERGKTVGAHSVMPVQL